MKKTTINKLQVFFWVGVFFFCTSCTQNVYEKGYIYDIQTVPAGMGRHFLRAYYTFNYQDSIYKGDYLFGKLNTYYMEKDSVWVLFPENKPGKSKLRGIAHRPEIPPKVVIRATANNDSLKILSIHSIENKPLFWGCETFEESEQKLMEFIYEKTKQAGFTYTGTMGISLVVSKMGTIERCNILLSSKDKDLDNFITKFLFDTPKGIAGKDNNGNNCKVRFLLHLDFDSYTEQTNAYIYSVKREHLPQVKNQTLWLVYYRFVYHGSLYEESFRCEGNNPPYLEQDSLLIEFPENKPEKSRKKSIMYRSSH